MATTFETTTTAFNFKQRAVSLTLGIACTVPLTSTVALAYTPVPQAMPTLPNASAGWQHTAGTASTHATTSGAAAAASFASYAAGAHTTLVHTLAPVVTHNALAGSQAAASTGVLNLASSQLSFLAGNLGNFQSLTINVGGKQEVVNLNTKLTAAEVVAVQQVLTGAGQTITIRGNGVASGGTVTLNNSLLNALDGSVGGSLNSLTVAKGVQVVDTLSSLNLAGGLSNYGSILTAASTSGLSDTISAGTVLNARGGSIGSYATGSGLYGADVNLNTSTALTNNGLIGSAGNVNISANTINNTGTIAAGAGNVNLASTGALTFNGTGGTVQANHGNVNFATNNADIAVNGGNILSQQVNYSAGTGNVNANMDQVTGVVNASGNNVHIYGNTAVLSLGSIDAANDPLFVNTTGDVDLATVIAPSNGAPLTVIAAGSIYDKGVSSTLDSSSTAAAGGAITLIAGATVTGGTGVASAVTKGSTSGGFIDLTGTNLNNDGSTGAVAIKSSSTGAGATSTGGDVQLIAYAGKTVGSGEVFTTSIDTSSTNGVAGNVTIIAGAKTGTAIQTGTITATSAAAPAAPTINIYASTPLITVTTKGAKGVDFDATGLQTANVFAPTKTDNAGGVVLGNVNSNGLLNIATAASASVTNVSSDLNVGTIVVGKTGTFTASNSSGAISLNSTIAGGTATLTSTGNGVIDGLAAAASINTTNLNLNVNTNLAEVDTNVANLQYTSAGGAITVTQTSPKTVLALNLSGTESGTGGNVIVNSTGQINVVGLTQVNGAGTSFTLNAIGKGGIAVNGLITVGTPNSGTININNTGTGKLTELKGTVISANQVNITSATSFGSKTIPIVTAETGNGAGLIVSNTGAKNISYISDQSTVNIIYNSALLSTGGSLFLTSTAPTLAVASVNYTNISFTDTATSAGASGVIFSGTAGNVLGVTTVTSASNIGGVGLLSGKTISLNGGTVGALGTLLVTTPTLTIVSKGGVNVTDNVPVVVTSAASLNSAFTTDIVDTAAGDAKTGASLTVGKAITGGAITLRATGSGGIITTGPVGASSTATVNIAALNSFVTTKGAILGGNIAVQAKGLLDVAGIVGQTGSIVGLSTVGATTNTLTVGGIVTGNNILISSVGAVVTTKAINGVDSNSFVNISGVGTASTNYATIGGAITGQDINISSANNTGNLAVNANIGLLASTSSVTLLAGTGAAPNAGTITGRGIIAGQSVGLESNTGIGVSATTPLNTIAANLFINLLAGDNSPAFIAQKGNLGLVTAHDSSLNLKVTGTLNVLGTVTSPSLILTSTGATSVAGTITDGGTAGTLAVTSAGFTAYANSHLTTVAASKLTLTSTNVTNLNGVVGAGTFNVNSTGLLTIGNTGSVINAADNITSKGGITVAGTLGNGTDVLAVSTTGALQVGLPNQTALVDGKGSLTGASITNYGTSEGSISYVVTGAGTATAPAFFQLRHNRQYRQHRYDRSQRLQRCHRYVSDGQHRRR